MEEQSAKVNPKNANQNHVTKLPGNSNSNGNRSIFQQQKRKASSVPNFAEPDSNLILPFLPTRVNIISELSAPKMRYCCSRCSSRGSRGEANCIFQNFGGRMDESVDFVLSLRQICLFKAKKERLDFIQKKFSSCIHGQKSRQDKEDGNEYYQMTYKINDHQLCRKTYLFCYGISKHEWEAVSKAMKQTPDAEDSVNLIYKVVPKDGEIPKFKRNKVEQIFLHNVLVMDKKTGEFRRSGGLLDQKMVSAALCPLAAPQANCVTYLENYFNTFSDFSPEEMVGKVEGNKNSSIRNTSKQ